MKAILLLCGIAAVVAFNVDSHNIDAALQFQSFMTQFEKKYETTAEYDHAFDNFKATLKRLDAYRAAGKQGFGITKFADLSREEFRSKYLMPKGVATKNIVENAKRVGIQSAAHQTHKHKPADPTTFNWVTQNATTPVKDQQQCGSCWAFSATENFESMTYLKNKKAGIPVLAPQQLVDCDPQSQGCGGGWTYWAFEYLMTAGGQEAETSYPYEGQNDPNGCQFSASKIKSKISNYKYATQPCESGACPVQDDLLKTGVLNIGPLSICVDAETWSDWTGPQPMAGADCPGDADYIDHCVQLVGYNFEDSSNQYWIVRNSWNTDWGQEGFIFLQYGQNTCGLGDVATYAIPA